MINHFRKLERKNTLKSASENSLRFWIIIAFSLIIVSAVVFYVFQNTGRLSGGNIALPKLIWLFYAIVFWFCLPALFIYDKRINSVWRKLYAIFFISMILRALIELFMMYISNNWSPYYGIGHDIFSIILICSLLLFNKNKIQRDIFLGYSITTLVMFVIEIYFVIYMLSNVVGTNDVIYFVPDEGKHTYILATTWLIDIILTYYLFLFMRRWLRADFISASR